MTSDSCVPALVTVVILTHNEERHVERCICSFTLFATEIVVIEAFSTDRTREIVEVLNARVYLNPWVICATQMSWVLKNVSITTRGTMRC